MASAVMLVVEQISKRTPWAALWGTLLAYVAFVPRAMDAGSTAYIWMIVFAAVVAAASTFLPGAHRQAAARTSILCGVATGFVLLGVLVVLGLSHLRSRLWIRARA